MKDGVEQPTDGPALSGDEPVRGRGRFRFDRSRQAVEEGSHSRSERPFELGKRVPQVILKRCASETLHNRSAEIQRGQLPERETRVVQPLKRTGAELPALLAVVRLVIQSKTSLLQSIQEPLCHPCSSQ